ncbi:hypothetical protein Ancab_029236 [Ancistrocladus abbreviatus]
MVLEYSSIHFSLISKGLANKDSPYFPKSKLLYGLIDLILLISFSVSIVPKRLLLSFIPHLIASCARHTSYPIFLHIFVFTTLIPSLSLLPLYCLVKMQSTYMDLNSLNKVWEIKPLKMAGENEARKILETVAKQVQPIMHKHKWKVRVLSEFCPSNSAILGLNIGHGAEVKLRLRPPNREWDFFPYEQILDTMLHELCHNDHGPHNAEFYKLLDEIRAECEELMAKGITGTGQGFDLPGRRLGGFTRQPPLASFRQNALAAAQNRARYGALLPSGPRRIGGDSNIKAALSPIQAAAMAAERRLHDDLWCSSVNNGFSSEVPEKPESSTLSDNISLQTANIESKQSHTPADGETTWQCSACTLINQPLALTCEACQTPRGKNVEPKSRHWSCKFCTLHNDIERDRCSACLEWRYSYGPSVSYQSPYFGT